MKLEEVKKFYKTITNLTNVLGLSRQAWYVWIKLGHVPIAQQMEIEKLTDGKLKADINDTRYTEPSSRNRKRGNGQISETGDPRSV